MGLMDTLTSIADRVRTALGTTDKMAVKDIPDKMDEAFVARGKLTGIIDRSITEITEEDLEGLTSTGSYAFAYCQKLTSIVIPDSVTTIGSGLFQGCTNLVTATLGSSVTIIGGAAFNSCTALLSITIPSSVSSIGGSAFNNCTALTSVTIPAKVTSIGGSAFAGCAALTTITLLRTTPPSLAAVNAIPTAHFPTDGTGDGKIIVPKGSLDPPDDGSEYDPNDYYSTAANWSTFKAYMKEADE